MSLRCLRCNDGAELFPGERCDACGAEADLETIVERLPVAQPTDTPPTHRVKLATTVKRGRAEFFVWECSCGASSALCTSQGLANEQYRRHKQTTA